MNLLRQVVAAHRATAHPPARPSGQSLLVGLIGRGIQLSRTPTMHEREAARLGLCCAYVLIDFDVLGLPDEALGEVLAAGAALGFQGFNVTHPFKQAILSQLDALAPEATAIGAVNTVVYAGGRSTGHNTDSWGFAESFKDGLADPPRGAVVQLGFQGFNVTHPFKQAILSQLDALAPEATAIGAVNTVVYAGGRSTGHNTDSWGFAESFRDGLADPLRDAVVQLGAGGAGAAVAHALMRLGVQRLVVHDSDASRSRALAGRMRKHWGERVQAVDDVAAALSEADGVVNTTPVGMAKYPGTPFPAEHLRPRQWVADIIYFPAETELLRAARALGCRTLAGTGMAIGQAVRAFELFTGRKSTMASMACHFEAAA